VNARFPIAMTAALVADLDTCNYSGDYNNTQKFVQDVSRP
jgi:hypothetical protein